MDLVWLTLLFPLLGFAVNALLGGRLPRRAPGIVASLAMLAAFAVAIYVTADLLALPHEQQGRDVILYNWVPVAGLTVPLGLWVDPLSALMLLIVTGVGFLIFVYATGYMADDEGQRRFFANMSIFVLAMLVLVLADNFMLLLVGWGGVGFASYALIAHYYWRAEAAAAAVKAFVVNTLGDVGMMLGMFLIFREFGTLQYFGRDTAPGVFDRAAGTGGGVLTAITLLLLVGAVAKSGQFPLHVWLPDAMAGPTPVSALIHAATMVTAGVYLLARAWPLYEAAPFTLGVIIWLGAITMVGAALLGVAQSNIKRVLAYSTISQLGYMFLAAGVGAYGAAVFHLMTHAFFKALLFLAAGVAIHALHGEEELPRMGGLRRVVPSAWLAFGLGGLAIAGIPPFSGFFSKDEIIWSAFFSARGNALLGLLALLTGGLTAFYVFRAFFLAFHGTARYNLHAVEGSAPGHGHEPAREHDDQPGDHAIHAPSFEMKLPLAVLGVLVVVGGWALIPGLTTLFEEYLEPVFAFPFAYASPVGHAGGASYWTVAVVAALTGLAGIGLAYVLYVARPALATGLATRFAGAHRLLDRRYYIDAFYDLAFVRSFRALARALSDGFDRLLDDLVDGVAAIFREASEALREVQTGYVRNYALMILGGTVLIFAFVVFRGLVQ